MCDTTLAIRSWIASHGRHTPAEVAIELGYDEKNILIIDGQWDLLKQRYPEYWQTILSNQHQADRRTPEKWAETMTYNWLLEDIMMRLLNNAGVKCRRSGIDKDRSILNSTNVSGTPDFIISDFNGNERFMEMNFNSNNYWKDTETMDLRDNKYKNLIRSNSLLFSICLSDSTFAILEPAYIPAESNYLQNFGKSGTTLDLRGTRWQRLLSKNLKDAIYSHSI